MYMYYHKSSGKIDWMRVRTVVCTCMEKRLEVAMSSMELMLIKNIYDIYFFNIQFMLLPEARKHVNSGFELLFI